MRTLIALVFAGLLAAGCAGEPAEPGVSPPTMTIGPEDTLPVLGAWHTAPMPATNEPLTLTLSDDNTYTVTDSCIEVPGRWQLSQGRVVLTPDDDGLVQCEDMSGDLPMLPDEYVVDGDTLLPNGEGPEFTR